MNKLIIPSNAITAFEKDRTIDIDIINNINFDGSNNLVFKLINGSAIIWTFPDIKSRANYFYALNEKITYNNLKEDYTDFNKLDILSVEQQYHYLLENKDAVIINFCRNHRIPGTLLSIEEVREDIFFLKENTPDDEYKALLTSIKDVIIKLINSNHPSQLKDLFEAIDIVQSSLDNTDMFNYYLFKSMIGDY